jgi:hypothetical protein
MNFIKVLKLLMPPEKVEPPQIAAMLTYIDTVVIASANADIHDQEHPGFMLNKVYDSVRRDMEDHKAVYQQYYGANFGEAERIVFNENTFSNYAGRNKTMYHNMMKEIKDSSIKKFITFNGLNHAGKSFVGWRSLCYLLANSPQFRHKLVNISMVCRNCYDWQLESQYRHAAFRAPATYVSDTSLLNNIYKNNFNTSCKYTLLPSTTTGNGIIANFSDYLILMQDQGEF